jgi:beta-glucosidase
VRAAMSLRAWILAFACAAACGQSGPPADLEGHVDWLLSQMTLEEKVAQMHGDHFYGGLTATAENRRLGIPALWLTDGPRGVREGTSTAFPVAALRGATWDPELERRVGEVMGRETQAHGANVLLAPTVNILRHPRWGRAQETYGEDPLHMAAMAVPFIEGVQETVLATIKHYAANSIEDTRFDVDVTVDERTLREIYLPHFRKAVKEANVASVMSAYNSVNGRYSAENPRLLSDILKGEWGFDGFVMSDWIYGVYTTDDSVLAGLDMEMPFPVYYGEALVAAVRAGRVPEAVVDDAVRRILRKKLEFRLDQVVPIDPSLAATPEHIALAREVADKGIVLLRNEDAALPLAGTPSIVVVGSLADAENTGDRGSSEVTAPYVITPLAGLVARAGAGSVTHIDADELSAADEAVIAAADVAIVVVGYTHEDEGESILHLGGDRVSLALRDEHAALVSAVAAHSDRTVVVLYGGSAIAMPWIDEVEAVLMAWYPGMEGGDALAAIIFGDVNPSGRLPVTFPVSEDQLPTFDNVSHQVTYGYFHGYRYMDEEGLEPLFPFGFGKSYTGFGYEALTLEAAEVPADGTIVARVEVENLGAVAGDEVVQLYVGYPQSAVARPLRDLRAFSRVRLEPGERRTIELRVPAAELSYYDVDAAAWVLEPVDYEVLVGPSSRDTPLRATVSVTPAP